MIIIVWTSYLHRAFKILNEEEKRKRAEESLRETSETLQEIFAASPVAIMALDRQGKVIKWSPAAERIFDGSEQEVIGRFSPIVPEDKFDEFWGDFTRVIGGEEFARAREVRRRKGRSSGRSVSWTTSRSAREWHRNARCCGNGCIVPKRWRRWGTLAGGVAHDLNNVLGVLVGYSELLLEKIPQGNPMRKYVANILKSGEWGAAIIQDLLTLARRGVAISEEVNLNEFPSETTATVPHRVVPAFMSSEIGTKLALTEATAPATQKP